MSQVAFSARFTVLSSILVPGYLDRWVVNAQILDMESTFYAHDVQLGFSVFLETGAMYPDSGPVSQYTVTQVVSVHNPAFNDIQVVLEYADSGVSIDPVVASYVPCFICETSSEGFSWMASADSQIISSRIVDYARNKDMTERLDTNLAGKADKADLETETHLITAPEAAAKRFMIAFTPAVPSEVVADVVGGVTASFANDFIIEGSEFVWEGLGFDGLLSAGDQIRLTYIK